MLTSVALVSIHFFGGSHLKPTDYLILFIKFISGYYPSFGCTLFCCVIWMLIYSTKSLSEEVVSAKEAATTTNWMFRIRDWKRQYYKIVRAVTHINSCFGMFLLIYVTSNFVTAINCAFTLLANLRLKKEAILDHIFFATYSIKELAFLFGLFYAPHKLKNEVAYYPTPFTP